MVNLELYRVFKIVADEENLTRASERLHISQPAVTKHIHNLEDVLKVKLFNRTKYGVSLTDDGKVIYSQIKDPINVLIQLENNINQLTTLNIGIHQNFPVKIYSQIISKIKKENLDIEINIIKSITENVFEMLEKQEVDAFLTKIQPTNLYSKYIKFIPIGNFSDKFIVNYNSKHFNQNILLNKKEELLIYTLRNSSSTSESLDKIIKEKRLENVIVKHMTLSSILEKFKNDEDIIAYITEEYVQEEIEQNRLKVVDLGLDTEKLEYGIYYNTNNKIKNIKKTFKNISNV